RGVTIRVRSDEKTSLQLDPSRMIEALANILDNAIRFSPAGASVDVTVQLNPSDAVVLVDDEGPGIAPANRDKVFERFTSASSALPGNLGLGLSIAREIVALHGGEIWAEERTPRGTRIAIRLPRETSESRARPKGVAMGAGS